MKKIICLIIVQLVFFTTLCANSIKLENVQLFQTFFEDASITEKPFTIGDINFADYKAYKSFDIGARGGLPLGSNIQIGSEIRFISINPDNGDSESGISDFLVTSKYIFDLEKTKIAAGGKLTLPIGSEDIGQSNTNFGIFGSVRHPVSAKAIINGVLGINFIEVGKDRETSLMLGFGSIFAVSDQICVIGELNFQTEIDYAILIGGIDYLINEKFRFRSGIGIGLDDGAPDIHLRSAFLINL